MLGGSLFDGIAGFPLAGQRVGIKFVWASEIEPFPISVAKRHFPDMKHLDDITKINGAKIEPVDVITFGSPCQDLSVAGKRAGLDGERSGLFMEAIRIIREMRDATNGLYPRFIVWENVPGAFSSNGGYDFQAVLSEISESEIPMPGSGGWAPAGMVRGGKADIAWRCLDAQHWGVPQRRKRIFLVADFRGRSAGEVLFKPEGLPGDFAESAAEREGTSGSIAVGVGATVYNESGPGWISPGFGCLRCEGENRPSRPTHTVVVPVGVGESSELGTDYLTGWDNQEKRIFSDRGVAPTLSGSDGGGGRTGVGYLIQTVPLDIVSATLRAGAGAPKHDADYKGRLVLTLDGQQTARTLTARNDGSPCIDRGPDAVLCAAFKQGNSATAGGIGYEEEKSPTLTAGQSGTNLVPAVVRLEVTGTQCASGAGMSRPAGMASETDLVVATKEGVVNGKESKRNPVALLRILRGEVGEETFSQWGFGIVASFQSQEILRQGMYGKSVRCERKPINKMVNSALSCKENCPERSVCYLWKAGCAGCPPQRWRPHEQLTRELTAYLSQLSQSPTQKTEILYCLWEASEGIRILQQALYPLQKIWKPINMQRYRVRRLLPIECERLMGFPDGYTAGGSDTSRYKALGNSVAIPCVEYIMAGIAECLRGGITNVPKTQEKPQQ